MCRCLYLSLFYVWFVGVEVGLCFGGVGVGLCSVVTYALSRFMLFVCRYVCKRHKLNKNYKQQHNVNKNDTPTTKKHLKNFIKRVCVVVYVAISFVSSLQTI